MLSAYKLHEGPKERKNYKRALELSTKGPGSLLERDQVLDLHLQETDEQPTATTAPAPRTTPLGLEQQEKNRAGR
jgi:hypothetical protein